MSEDLRNDPNTNAVAGDSEPAQNQSHEGLQDGVPDTAGAGPPGADQVSWRPADYYAAPRSAPKLPRWIPLTCGVAAIVMILLMVALGAFLRSGGLAKLVALSFGQVNAEAGSMFADDVDQPARTEFGAALLAVRDAIADGKIELAGVLPLLQEIQQATRDRSLSRDEVDRLTVMLERALGEPKTPGDAEQPAGTPPIVDL